MAKISGINPITEGVNVTPLTNSDKLDKYESGSKENEFSLTSN